MRVLFLLHHCLLLLGSEFAVRVIIGPLMLASFVMHILFGCCLHQICGSEWDARTTVAENASDCGLHHNDHSGQDSGEHQCPDDNCRGCQCVFTRAETESGCESWADTALAAIPAYGCEANLSSDGRNRAVRSRHGVLTSTVGVYLLHQRFLL